MTPSSTFPHRNPSHLSNSNNHETRSISFPIYITLAPRVSLSHSHQTSQTSSSSSSSSSLPLKSLSTYR
uniref:Uncharacterized protein n=1 Tax=Salix viminalis TaxID=40686 RepID=A0A6N2NGS2_SALVM